MQRLWLDLVRAGFVAAALAYAVAVGNASFLLFAALGVVAVRAVALPRLYDGAFVLAMVLVGWGEALRVYERFPAYDEIVHAVVPFLVAPVIYLALARLDVLPDPAAGTARHARIGVAVATFALGLSAAALWEIFEWSADHLAGTSFVPSTQDVLVDLIAGAWGALAAGGFLVVWTTRRWPSADAGRRHPGAGHDPAGEETPRR